jgi:hypothetical protein
VKRLQTSTVWQSQAVERGERRVTLRFRPDPAIRERVESLVAAESSCCSFPEFTLADEEDATVVSIAAPEGGESARAGRTARRGRRRVVIAPTRIELALRR